MLKEYQLLACLQRDTMIFALFGALFLARVVDGQCGGGGPSDDFGVLYDGVPAFSISRANGTCYCPGGFSGPGAGLSGVVHDAEMTALIGSMQRRIDNLTATIDVLKSQAPAGTGGVVLSDTLNCTSTNMGAFRLTSKGWLQLCFNNTWKTASLQSSGATPELAAPSCDYLRHSELLANSGLYWIDPGQTGVSSNAIQVYCDLQAFEAGGWIRVHTVTLGTSCPSFSSLASSNPALGPSCSKYSDALINQLAPNKMFFSRLASFAQPPLITRFNGTIRIDGPPGAVFQTTTSVAAALAGALLPALYGGWKFFHQQDWYQTDTCRGAPPASFRLSQEYIMSTSNGVYGCSGVCNANCPTSYNTGFVEVFVR
eukprot:TRINITY_DN1687_c0_g2_i1.p1 TRINITY_DN1687_c0_g2~~TRINITY_DN1687_c0_g2_i1.p1  ORF type:complete len:382 (+),score=79.12 TRINITY_DN1687_c0_g2_i1:38-1147(+)